MLTWQQFFEAKEKDDPALAAKEEELHKDLDNDNEEGESKEHKVKVLGLCKACGKKDCKCCKTCSKSKKSCKC